VGRREWRHIVKYLRQHKVELHPLWVVGLRAHCQMVESLAHAVPSDESRRIVAESRAMWGLTPDGLAHILREQRQLA
jgi:hypothetical protein